MNPSWNHRRVDPLNTWQLTHLLSSWLFFYFHCGLLRPVQTHNPTRPKLIENQSALPSIRSILYWIECVCVRRVREASHIQSTADIGGSVTCSSRHTPLSKCKSDLVCEREIGLLLASGPVILMYCYIIDISGVVFGLLLYCPFYYRYVFSVGLRSFSL